MLKQRTIGLLIVGMLCGMALGCSKEKQPRDSGTIITERFALIDARIERVIHDEQLEEILLLIVSENRLAYGSVMERFVELQHEIRKHPEWSPEEVEARVEVFSKFRESRLEKIAHGRMYMRELLTEDQWNAIFRDVAPNKEK